MINFIDFAKLKNETHVLINVVLSIIGTIVSLPFKAIGAVMSIFSSDDDKENDNQDINPFQLTAEQNNAVNGLRKLVVANVDKKTGVTSISVTMQDPLVCAIVADTVVTKLQEFITGYRVNKAQEDCKYWEQLYNQRQQNITANRRRMPALQTQTKV